VTAKGVGKTEIYVVTADNAKDDSCTIYVTKPDPLTSLCFDAGEDIILDVNANYQLLVVSNRGYEDPGLFTWHSSDPSIAQVDPSGLVASFGKEGAATITASTADGSLTATCRVAVIVGLVYFSPSEPFKDVRSDSWYNPSYYKVLYLNGDPLFQLVPNIVCPENLIERLSFSYESDDPSIAAVSADGLVTALKLGVTKVRCKLYVFGVFYMNSPNVEIRVYNKLMGARLDRESLDLWCPTGPGAAKLSVVCDPEGAHISTDWSSSAPGIVAVDGYGNVTAKAAGSATITATVSHGSGALFGTYTCQVAVHESVSAVSVAAVDSGYTGFLENGKPLQLGAVIGPVSVQTKIQSTEWSSSDTSLATVDSTGKVIAKHNGAWQTVTISVKVTDNGGTSATGSITISVGTP